ncbi:MAG: hypothetical protein WCL39_01075 [Armatimonadota bacterium]
MNQQQSSAPTQGRRSFLRIVIAAALGGISGAAAWAKESVEGRPAIKTEGEILKQRVSLGEPPVEPLDTMMHFRRSDNSTGRAMTHEVLSLSHEELGKNSYPWTIYAHLGTHHETGDACVFCGRLHKYGPGWSTGLHSEVFTHNRGVALGANIEMFNDYKGSEPTQVYGVNIQSIPSSPQPCDIGLHIHGDGKWKKGIEIDSTGDVGIDVKGSFKTGLDLHGQELKLGEGGSILLDEKEQIRLQYRDGALEVLKGTKRVLHLPFADRT